MNLHGIVRGVITAINPDRTISLLRSTGYTVLPGGKQVPTQTTLSGPAQIQALGPSDLKHMNDLNLQGVMRKVYLYGNWQGAIRADATGGDVLQFAQIPGGAAQNWKVVTVFESWPDWCSVGVVLQ